MDFSSNKSFECNPGDYQPSGSSFTPTIYNTPWNVSLMPWSSSSPNEGVMEFKGSKNIVKIPDLSKVNLHAKRKSDLDCFIPKKHLITEEKMVAHMNGLHISGNYISHQLETNANGSTNTRIFMTTEELEEKLKNAQSITVCDEVRKISMDPILPRALLERIERPCTALVVWQPPQKLQNFYNNLVENNQIGNNSQTNSNSSNNKKEDDCIEDDEFEEIETNNNNITNIDSRNSMELDNYYL